MIFIMTVFFLSLGLMAAGEITSTFAVSPAAAKQTVEEEPLKKENTSSRSMRASFIYTAFRAEKNFS